MRVREANERWAAYITRLVDEQCGGNQSALAERLGVSPATVNRWIGGATPVITQIRRLSDELGIPVTVLLVEAGALREGEIGGDLPVATPDVLTAIDVDRNLVEEAKQHLRNQYELLLRIPELSEQRGKSQRGRQKPSDPKLRAVARGGRPEDQAEVAKLAKRARRDFEEAKRERDSNGGDRR